MGRLRRVWQYLVLRRADPLLLARAYALLAGVDVSLRTRGFQGTIRAAEAVSPPAGRILTTDDLRLARRRARRIRDASRFHVVRARCLHRSLALHQWLRADGLPSELRIGVRKQGGQLKAHAWVELGQHVVTEPSVTGFAPLDRPAGERGRSSGHAWG